MPASVELAGERVELLTYNGQFPGPVLRAAEGDLHRVDLVNHLDEPTNLHFHGLHVSPGGNSDNVFVSVPPGGRFLYELRIPAGQGGAFWYAHHRLARQLWRRLAGPLIIDRPADHTLGLTAADEQVVVLKDLTVVDDGPAPHTTGLGTRQERQPRARQRPAAADHHRQGPHRLVAADQRLQRALHARTHRRPAALGDRP